VSHASPGSGVEVPDVDIASYVLEGTGADERALLVDGPSGRALTGPEIARSVAGIAAGLAERGVAKGDVVGLFMPNLPEYALCFHGICAAGAVNTTANPLYTPRELAYQLGDSGARMLITVPPFLETALAAAADTAIDEVFVVGEAAGATPLSELVGDPEAAPSPDMDAGRDLAVLPYSSGTTGLPKGVMLTHRNLVANLCQVQQALTPGPDDTLIAVLPFFHIYGQTVIMNLGLRTGAKIVTMPRFDLDQFLGLIAEHRVTRAYVVPPIAIALAKHPAIDDADLSSLELIMSGAAPLGSELADAVAERVGCPVMQGYGMTETSPVTHVVPPERSHGRGGSIGLPLADTECRVVDPGSGEDAERGELWIRGPQVMKGYLNNDEATAETIDPDGWLHTGDVAVVDSDGYYEIVDRLKELIKYKGFQVPPAELEGILITHPAVSDAAVIGIPDDEAGELPKAFVVAGDEVSDDEIMEFVAGQVSPQKRVRLIERVDEIPKSPSGKILRRVLAEREPAKSA
jgi:acyl-CoA synthetase (AMP-forming)/AMP-acid ligase II